MARTPTSQDASYRIDIRLFFDSRYSVDEVMSYLESKLRRVVLERAAQFLIQENLSVPYVESETFVLDLDIPSDEVVGSLL